MLIINMSREINIIRCPENEIKMGVNERKYLKFCFRIMKVKVFQAFVGSD